MAATAAAEDKATVQAAAVATVPLPPPKARADMKDAHTAATEAAKATKATAATVRRVPLAPTVREISPTVKIKFKHTPIPESGKMVYAFFYVDVIKNEQGEQG